MVPETSWTTSGPVLDMFLTHFGPVANNTTPLIKKWGVQIGPKTEPKSGPDFWTTGPERDLGPDAPVFSPNGAMATQNSPNPIFGKPTLGKYWTHFNKIHGNHRIMAPNGDAKKMRAGK